MILFAVKCSRNPQSLTDEDYEKLRRMASTVRDRRDNRDVSIRGLCEHHR